MAIDIYDKADIVKKDDTYYYFVKNGSKNCWTCPNQTIVDNNFKNKFIRRQSRESNWHLVAFGKEAEVKADRIAETNWNCPTSYYYGIVKFGDKLNIALYFVKRKNRITDYNLLDEEQKANIDHEINYYMNELKGEYTIDLANIQDKDKKQDELNYCDKVFNIADNCINYNNIRFWQLDNL